MYNGYVRELTEEEKRKNLLPAIREMVRKHPENAYWKSRLAELEGEQCCCFEIAGDNDRCPIHGKQDATNDSLSLELRDAGLGSGGAF